MKIFATIAILLGVASAAIADEATVKLEYKFNQGDVIRSKITHLSTVDTKIKGVKQTAQSRSISTRKWEVQKVDESGLVTFMHSVENINMWQKVTDRPEVSYNSETDKTPPAIYAQASQSVGVPLSRITVDAQGRLVKREHLAGTPSSESQILPILPADPVAVDAAWYSPDDLTVRTGNGALKRIKTRQVFRLVNVSAGVATITTETQVLTPIDDPMLKVELIQKLTKGKFRFDIEQGRILSQQIDLDERVIGFQGEESVMNYLGRMTEELINAEPAKVAALPASAKKTVKLTPPAEMKEESPTPADPATKPAEKAEPDQAPMKEEMPKEDSAEDNVAGVPTLADPATKPKEEAEPLEEVAEVPTLAAPETKKK
ncbi:hypothetical protein DTL42_20490 [Bremerella cremea]|uniref:DUF4412 domain-containing protein n=1 Tax=Bremerella cremea TaxID=1031537 RepID=A0A368KQI8_9BACT|nr:hypothetical protein [Bremerella cremea]RCS42210.1 hypothetical protein DTL42_20490 [Bremerella cremea]